LALTIDSQLRLRELYAYLDRCRAVLDGMGKDLSLIESDPGNLDIRRRCTERMKDFCVDADAWGFDALYEIAWRLQMVLLNARGGPDSGVYRDALRRSLGMLSSLLDQCESDFRRRLAVADMLESLDQILRE